MTSHIQTLNCHGITRVEIEDRGLIGVTWVKLSIINESGHELAVNLFFDKPHQREMLLEQIGQKVLA